MNINGINQQDRINSNDKTTTEYMLYTTMATANKLGVRDEQILSDFMNMVDAGGKFVKEDFNNEEVKNAIGKNNLTMDDIYAIKDKADEMFMAINQYKVYRDVYSYDESKKLPMLYDYTSGNIDRLRTSFVPLTPRTFHSFGYYDGVQYVSNKKISKAIGLQDMDTRPEWQKSFAGRASQLLPLAASGNPFDRMNYAIGSLVPWSKQVLRYDPLGIPYIDRKLLTQMSYEGETVPAWNQPYARSGFSNFWAGFYNILPSVIQLPGTILGYAEDLSKLFDSPVKTGSEYDLRLSNLNVNSMHMIKAPKTLLGEQQGMFGGQNFWFQSGDAIGQVVAQIAMGFATGGISNVASLASKAGLKALFTNIGPYALGGLLAVNSMDDMFKEAGVQTNDRLWMLPPIFIMTTLVEKLIGIEPAELYFKKGLAQGAEQVIKQQVESAGKKGASVLFKDVAKTAEDMTQKQIGIGLKNLGKATAKEKELFFTKFMRNTFGNLIDRGQMANMSGIKRFGAITFGEGFEENVEEFGHSLVTTLYNYANESKILIDPNRNFLEDYNPDKNFLQNYAGEVLDIEKQGANFLYGSIGGFGGAVINTTFRAVARHKDPRLKSYQEMSFIQAILADSYSKEQLYNAIDNMQLDLEITQQEAGIDLGPEFKGLNLNEAAKAMAKQSVDMAFEYAEQLRLKKFKAIHPHLSNDINFLGKFLAEIRSYVYMNNLINEYEKKAEGKDENSKEFKELQDAIETKEAIKKEIDRYLNPKEGTNTSMSEKGAEVMIALAVQQELFKKYAKQDLDKALEAHGLKVNDENRKAFISVMAYNSVTSALKNYADDTIAFNMFEAIRKSNVPLIVKSFQEYFNAEQNRIMGHLGNVVLGIPIHDATPIIQEILNVQDKDSFTKALQILEEYGIVYSSAQASMMRNNTYTEEAAKNEAYKHLDEQYINKENGITADFAKGIQDTFDKLLGEFGTLDNVDNAITEMLEQQAVTPESVLNAAIQKTMYAMSDEFYNSQLYQELVKVYGQPEVSQVYHHTDKIIELKFGDKRILLLDTNADVIDAYSFVSDTLINQAEELIQGEQDGEITNDEAKLLDAKGIGIQLFDFLTTMNNIIDVAEAISNNPELSKFMPHNPNHEQGWTFDEEGNRTFEEPFKYNKEVRDNFEAYQKELSERINKVNEAIDSKNVMRSERIKALSAKESIHQSMLWLDSMYDENQKKLVESLLSNIGDTPNNLLTLLEDLHNTITEIRKELGDKNSVEIISYLANSDKSATPDTESVISKIRRLNTLIASEFHKLYNNTNRVKVGDTEHTIQEGMQNFIGSLLHAYNRGFSKNIKGNVNLFDSYFVNNNIFSFSYSQDIDMFDVFRRNNQPFWKKALDNKDLYNKAYHILVNMIHTSINIDMTQVDIVMNDIARAFTNNSEYVPALDQLIFSKDVFAILTQGKKIDDFVIRKDLDIKQEELAKLDAKDDQAIGARNMIENRVIAFLDTENNIVDFMSRAYSILGNAGTGKSMVMPGLLSIAYALLNKKNKIKVSFIAAANTSTLNALGTDAKNNILRMVESYNKGAKTTIDVEVEVIDMQKTNKASEVDLSGFDMVFIDEASKLSGGKNETNLTTLKAKHLNMNVKNREASHINRIKWIYENHNSNNKTLPFIFLTDNQQTYSDRNSSGYNSSRILMYTMFNMPLQYIYRASNNQIQNMVDYFGARTFNILGNLFGGNLQYVPPKLSMMTDSKGIKHGGKYFSDVNEFISEFIEDVEKNSSTMLVVATQDDKKNILKKFKGRINPDNVYVLYNEIHNYNVLGAQGLSADNVYVFVENDNSKASHSREMLTAITRAKNYVAVYDTVGENATDTKDLVLYRATDSNADENIAQSNLNMISTAFAYANTFQRSGVREATRQEMKPEPREETQTDVREKAETNIKTKTDEKENIEGREEETREETVDDVKGELTSYEGYDVGDTVTIKVGSKKSKRVIKGFKYNNKGEVLVEFEGYGRVLKATAIVKEVVDEPIFYGEQGQNVIDGDKQRVNISSNSVLAPGAVFHSDLQGLGDISKSIRNRQVKTHTSNIVSFIFNDVVRGRFKELFQKHNVALRLEYKPVEVHNWSDGSPRTIYTFTLSMNRNTLIRIAEEIENDTSGKYNNALAVPNSIRALLDLRSGEYIQIGFLNEQAYNNYNLLNTNTDIEADIVKKKKLSNLINLAKQLNSKALDISINNIHHYFNIENQTVEFGEKRSGEIFTADEIYYPDNYKFEQVEGTLQIDGKQFGLKEGVYLNTKSFYDIAFERYLSVIINDINRFLSVNNINDVDGGNFVFRLFKVAKNREVLGSLLYDADNAVMPHYIDNKNLDEVKKVLRKLVDIMITPAISENAEILKSIYLPVYNENGFINLRNLKTAAFAFMPRVFFRNGIDLSNPIQDTDTNIGQEERTDEGVSDVDERSDFRELSLDSEYNTTVSEAISVIDAWLGLNGMDVNNIFKQGLTHAGKIVSGMHYNGMIKLNTVGDMVNMFAVRHEVFHRTIRRMITPNARINVLEDYRKMRMAEGVTEVENMDYDSLEEHSAYYFERIESIEDLQQPKRTLWQRFTDFLHKIIDFLVGKARLRNPSTFYELASNIHEGIYRNQELINVKEEVSSAENIQLRDDFDNQIYSEDSQDASEQAIANSKELNNLFDGNTKKLVSDIITTLLVAETPFNQHGSAFSKALNFSEAADSLLEYHLKYNKRIARDSDGKIYVYRSEGDDYVRDVRISAFNPNYVFETSDLYYVKEIDSKGNTEFKKLTRTRYIAARLAMEYTSIRGNTFIPLELFINEILRQKASESKEAHILTDNRKRQSTAEIGGVDFATAIKHLEIKQFVFQFETEQKTDKGESKGVWKLKAIHNLAARRGIDNSSLSLFASIISDIAKRGNLDSILENGVLDEYSMNAIMKEMYSLMTDYAYNTSDITQNPNLKGAPANFNQNTIGTLYDYIFGIYEGQELIFNNEKDVVIVNDEANIPSKGYYIYKGTTYNADSLYNKYKRIGDAKVKRAIEDFFVAMVNNYKDVVNNNFVNIKDGKIINISSGTQESLKNVLKTNITNRIFQNNSYRKWILHRFSFDNNYAYRGSMFYDNNNKEAGINISLITGNNTNVLVRMDFEDGRNAFYIPYTKDNINEKVSMINELLHTLNINLPYHFVHQLITSDVHDGQAIDILRQGQKVSDKASLSNYVLGSFIAASTLSLQYASIAEEIARVSVNEDAVNHKQNNIDITNKILDIVYQSNTKGIETYTELETKIKELANQITDKSGKSREHINKIIETAILFRNAAYAFRGLQNLKELNNANDIDESLENIDEEGRAQYTPGPHHFDIALDLLTKGLLNQSSKTSAAWVNGQMYQHQSKTGNALNKLQRYFVQTQRGIHTITSVPIQNRTINSLSENPMSRGMFVLESVNKVLSQKKLSSSSTELTPIDVFVNGILGFLDSVMSMKYNSIVPAMMYGESTDLFFYTVADGQNKDFRTSIVSDANNIIRSYVKGNRKSNQASVQSFLNNYGIILKSQFRGNHIEHQQSVRRLHTALVHSNIYIQSLFTQLGLGSYKYSKANLSLFTSDNIFDNIARQDMMLSPLLVTSENTQQFEEAIKNYNFFGALEMYQKLIDSFVDEINRVNTILQDSGSDIQIDAYDLLLSKGVISTLDIIKGDKDIEVGNALGVMTRINKRIDVNKQGRYQSRDGGKFTGEIMYRNRHFFYQKNNYTIPVKESERLSTLADYIQNAPMKERSIFDYDTEFESNLNKAAEKNLHILKLLHTLYNYEFQELSRHLYNMYRNVEIFDKNIQKNIKGMLQFGSIEISPTANHVWYSDDVLRTESFSDIEERINWAMLSYYALYQAVNNATSQAMYGHNFNFKNPADKRARTQQAHTPGTGFIARTNGLGNKITQVFMKDPQIDVAIKKLTKVGDETAIVDAMKRIEGTDGLAYLPAIMFKRFVASSGGTFSVIVGKMGKPVAYGHDITTGRVSINKYAHYSISGDDVQYHGEGMMIPDLVALQVFDNANGTNMSDLFLNEYYNRKNSDAYKGNISGAFNDAIDVVDEAITEYAERNGIDKLNHLAMLQHASTQKAGKYAVNTFNVEQLSGLDAKIDAINSGQEFQINTDMNAAGISRASINTSDLKMIYDTSHDFENSRNTIFSQLTKEVYANMSIEDALEFDTYLAEIMRDTLRDIGIRIDIDENGNPIDKSINFQEARKQIREVMDTMLEGFNQQKNMVGVVEEMVKKAKTHEVLLTHPQLAEKLRQAFSTTIKNATGKMKFPGAHYIQAPGHNIVVYDMTIKQGDYVTTFTGSEYAYNLMQKSAKKLGFEVTAKARKLRTVQPTEDGYMKAEAIMQTVNQSQFGVRYGESMYDYNFFEMKIGDDVTLVNIDDINEEGEFVYGDKIINLFNDNGDIKYEVLRGNLILNNANESQNTLKTINDFKKQKNVLVVRKPTPNMSSGFFSTQIEFRFDNVHISSEERIGWDDSDYDIDALYGYEYTVGESLDGRAGVMNSMLDMMDRMYAQNNHKLNQSLDTGILKSDIAKQHNHDTLMTDIRNTENMHTGMEAVGIYANSLSVSKLIRTIKNHPELDKVINRNAEISNARFKEILNKIFEQGDSEQYMKAIYQNALMLQAALDNLKNPLLGQMGIKIVSVNEIAAMILYGLQVDDIVAMYNIRENQLMQIFAENGGAFFNRTEYTDAFLYYTKKIQAIKGNDGKMYYQPPNMQKVASDVVNTEWNKEGSKIIEVLRREFKNKPELDNVENMKKLLLNYIYDKYGIYSNAEAIINDDKFVDNLKDWLLRVAQSFEIEDILDSATDRVLSPESFYHNIKKIAKYQNQKNEIAKSFVDDSDTITIKEKDGKERTENYKDFTLRMSDSNINFIYDTYMHLFYSEMQAFAMVGKILSDMTFLEDITDGPNSKAEILKSQIDSVSMAIGKSLLEATLANKEEIALDHSEETEERLLQYYKENDRVYNRVDADGRKILEYMMREIYKAIKIGNILQLMPSYMASAEVLIGHIDIIGSKSILNGRNLMVLQEHVSRALGIGSTGNSAQYFGIRSKIHNFYLGEVIKKYINESAKELKNVNLTFEIYTEGAPYEAPNQDIFKELDLTTPKGRELFAKYFPDYMANLKDLFRQYVEFRDSNNPKLNTIENLLDEHYSITNNEAEIIYNKYKETGRTFLDAIDHVGSTSSSRLVISGLQNLKNQTNLYQSTKDLFVVVPEHILELLGIYEVLQNKFSITSASLFDMIGVEYFTKLLSNGEIFESEFIKSMSEPNNFIEVIKEIAIDDRIIYPRDAEYYEGIKDDLANLANNYSFSKSFQKIKIEQADRVLFNNNRSMLFEQDVKQVSESSNKKPLNQTGTAASFTQMLGQSSVKGIFAIRNLSAEELNALWNGESVYKYYPFKHNYNSYINEKRVIYDANRVMNVIIEQIHDNYIVLKKTSLDATFYPNAELSSPITQTQKIAWSNFNKAIKKVQSLDTRTKVDVARTKPRMIIEGTVVQEFENKRIRISEFDAITSMGNDGGKMYRVMNAQEVDKFLLRTLSKEGFDTQSQITPQQKQQAQQLYSQYLDTVFPDSKVKDIVYHGGEKTFEQFSLETKDRASGTSQIKKGIYLSRSKNVAKGYVQSKESITSNALNRILDTIEKSLGLKEYAVYGSKEDGYAYEEEQYKKPSEIISKLEKLYGKLTKDNLYYFSEEGLSDYSYMNQLKDFENINIGSLIDAMRTDDIEKIKSIISEYEANNKDTSKLYSVIVNLKNPTIISNKETVSIYRSLIGKESLINKAESVIVENVDDSAKGHMSEPSDTIIVFEPEQTHILGSKQDIEGFKEFVSNENNAPKENIKSGVSELFDSNPELANEVYEALGLNTINPSEITYTDEEGNPCAKMGLTNTVKGTNWKIVKDFKGQPKHSQGGVDITISDSGVTMRRGGKDIKAKHGLLISNNN